MAEEFTAKFKVDISDLKKNISEASKQIKLANATFKSETSGMESWAKNADGLGKKLEQLKTVLSAQKSILSSYEAQLKKQEAAYTENGNRAEQLKAKLQDLANNGVSKTDAEYKKYETALKTVLTEQSNNAKACDDLKMKILDQKGAIGQTEAAINKYSTAQKNLEKESTSLSSAVKKQEKQLSELKAEYIDVAASEGKNSDAAKALARQIEDLSGELKQNKKALNDAEKEANELDKSLDDLDDSTNKAQGGFTILKGALADLAANGINIAINALKDMARAAYEAWQSYDEGADAIIASTGKTGEAAQQIISVYENVARNVIGNFDEIGIAVGSISTRFGLTGDQLESTAEKFIKFADINKIDVKTSIENVQSAMSAFGISANKTGDVLDVLNAAGQKTGVSMDQLSQALIANAPALKEMGMNVSDSAMFIAGLSKNGIEASAVMTGMKKALVNASKEGKPLKEAMQEIEESIKNASTATESITIASELFGNKAGAAIAVAVREGRLSFQEFGTTLNDFNGSIESTYEAMLDAPDRIALSLQNLKLEAGKIFDEFLTKHEPEITSAINTLTNDVFPKLSVALEIIGKVLKTEFNILAQYFTNILNNIINVFEILKPIPSNIANAFKLAIDAIKSAWSTIVEFFKGLWEGIKNVFASVKSWFESIFNAAADAIKSIWNGVVTFFKSVWDSISNVFAVVKDVLTGDFQAAWDGIQSIVGTWVSYFQSVWNGIKNVFSAVKSWFASTFQGAWNAIKSAFSSVASFFSGIWNQIKSAFKISEMASVGSNLVTGLWNGISNKVGWIVSKIKGFGQQVMNAMKQIFGIKSPSKVMEKEVGNMIVYGLGNGITKKSKWLNSRASKVVDSLKDVFTGNKGFDINSPSKWSEAIGKYIDEGLANGIKTKQDYVLKAINSLITDSRSEVEKVMDDMNKTLLESEVLYQRESLRLSEEYSAAQQRIELEEKQASKEIKDGENNDEKDALKEKNEIQKEANKLYLENMKQTNSDYLEQLKQKAETERKIYDAEMKDAEAAKKNIINVFSQMASEVYSEINALQKLQDDFAKKLEGQTNLIQKVIVSDSTGEQSFFKLADISEQTQQLEDFYELLMNVKNRGNVPREFFEMLRNMSVEEATKTSRVLLSLSDQEFNQFFENWLYQREVEARIAKEVYAEEAAEIVKNTNEKFNEIAENFLKIGKDSADEFEAGFTENLMGVLNRIRAVVSTSLGNLFPNGSGSLAGIIVPKLAKGGILERGQTGFLEGDGAEAVVPLEKNKEWIRAVANDLLSNLKTSSGGIGVSSMTRNNEYNFTQVINAPKQPSRIELYRQTRNLLAFASGKG